MKLTIKKITALAGFTTCLLLPWTAQGAWMLLDDFESYITDGTYIAGGDPDLVYHINSNGGLGEMDIYSGVAGAGGNNAAHFWYGQNIQYAADVWHQLPLPQEIPVNGQGTIFFRFYMFDYAHNMHIMTTKFAVGEQLDNAALWSNHGAILRYNADEPLGLDLHNGGYNDTNPLYLPALETWYNVWLTIDNSFNELNEQTGTWSLYIQGPDDAAPVQIAAGGETPVTSFAFRNKDYSSVKTLTLIQNDQHGDGVWLIDDIYVADSITTTDPRDGDIPMWCGLPIVDDTVDTGDWMGMIYVGYADDGWVYNYSISQWVYAPECPGEAGGWVYVVN